MSPLFDRPPIDAISVSNSLFSSGTFRITGGPNITVGSDASGASISGAGVPTLDFFDNAGAGSGATALASTAMTYNTMLIQPLTPNNEVFPANLTANTMNLQFSFSATASSSHSSTVGFAIYTKVNSTQLSLLNSVQTTWAQAAATNQTASYQGQRWLTIHSSLWSAQPTFTQGNYWFGMFVRSSNASHTNSFIGQFLQAQGVRSGTVMSSVTSGNTTMAHYPFMGIHSVSQTNFPVSIGATAINKAHALANFIPHVIFNNAFSVY